MENKKIGCLSHYCWIKGNGDGMRTNSMCKCLDGLEFHNRTALQRRINALEKQVDEKNVRSACRSVIEDAKGQNKAATHIAGSLFDESHRYTNEASDLDHETLTVCQGMFRRWVREYGYSPREVEYIMAQTINYLTQITILNWDE